MKKFFLLYIFYSFTIVGYSQPPTETVGNPAFPTSVNTYTGWVNQGVLTFSGNAEVQNAEPSNNRLGSGGGNVFFSNTIGINFEISNFPTPQAKPDRIELIFGMHNYDEANLSELYLEYSTNGLNYFKLPYSRYLPELYPATPWAAMEASFQNSIDIKNLRLRFTQTSSSKQFRIDDIFLRYYSLLPIKLQQFSASVLRSTVNLVWKASSGSDKESFVVEKSTDGHIFNFAAEQTAKGSGTYNYQFTENPTSATTYYRLKMKNEEGTFTYSNVLRVNTKAATKNLIQNIYPLPTKGTLNLQFQSGKAEQADVVITDVSGKTLIKKSISLLEGTNHSFINIHSLNQGVYLLKIVTRQGNEIRKIVVEE